MDNYAGIWNPTSPSSGSNSPPVDSATVGASLSPSSQRCSPSPLPESPSPYQIGCSDHYVTYTDLMVILRDYVRVEEFNSLKAENERLRKQLQRQHAALMVCQGEDVYSGTIENMLNQTVLNSKDGFEAVKNSMKLLFSDDEILACSVTGQKARSAIKAKPRFDPQRYGMMLRVVRRAFQMKVTDITKKVHSVQKTLKRTRATQAVRNAEMFTTSLGEGAVVVVVPEQTPPPSSITSDTSGSAEAGCSS
ncbi:uncharacterized protein [Ambystoma mexicanum]|uniref:uncharacterized protein n=1 Tax=Ambystoma mexicanum TaxID=8296 RepID=UPI0037E85F2A